MPAATSREVVDRFLRLTAKGPAEETADVFSEDAVFEMPFLPPGAPAQEAGREAFRAHLRGAAGLQEFDSVDTVRIHETADPEVVVVEHRLHGRVIATGKRFALDIVMIARVRDGLIVWSRTYSNPLDGAIAFDMVHDLLTGLTAA
ncbi:nuclear transport factor 2 family protein [Kitasatospora sp. NBC_01287]|uniref:nuclear transport factor 2 family protein n=1 Tax=Kitasatospora sp. NBC_01287 TaxID=2903573 RepID=UPI00224E6489|nr:nuclear transport factor 2 family protein [Kitasatospora sp. NBC_01287]MCX4744087.1 nuclear transport factor 2 family protein [Kitasatospora sp. NBC_01287]